MADRGLKMPHSWHELPAGDSYRKALQDVIAPWWPKIYGVHLLKLGDLSIDLPTDSCSVFQQVPFESREIARPVELGIRFLPYSNHFFDVCLLAQTLCYEENPQVVLRESDRVLAEGGWLLISGFNPISLLGLCKLLPMVRRRKPYNSHMITRHRVLDWLSLLNYRIELQCTFQVLPGASAGPWPDLADRICPLLGCQYLIIARKLSVPFDLRPYPCSYRTVWSESRIQCCSFPPQII